MSRARLVALLVCIPVAVLVGLDRLIVLDRSQWEYVADEAPIELMDVYRVEALLRTLPPDRGRVVILGNSTGNKSFDLGLLDAAFSERKLHFEKLTIGASSTATVGMLANAIADLEPAAAILVVGAPAVRSAYYLPQTMAYDFRAVSALFTPSEIFEHARFHLIGLVRQSNVFARLRGPMQRVALIRIGLTSWGELAKQARRQAFRQAQGGSTWATWLRDVRRPDVYPNPNTRAISYLNERLRERGAKLIALESPSEPLVQMLVGMRRFGHFRSHMAELAEAGGFPFVSAGDYPEIEEDDFEDMIHLNENGRRIFTEYITPTLAELL